MGNKPSLFKDYALFDYGNITPLFHEPYWLTGMHFVNQLSPGDQSAQELTLHLVLRMSERPKLGYQYMVYAVPDNFSENNEKF